MEEENNRKLTSGKKDGQRKIIIYKKSIMF
jgi:hypothetical protein